MLDKNGIAKRIAKEVQDGFYVNLGIGIPTLVANFVRDDIDVEYLTKYTNEDALDMACIEYIDLKGNNEIISSYLDKILTLEFS